jgi:diguanylate cyclase (GGDEF)-like protein/PAS domain S-box-containing protein
MPDLIQSLPGEPHPSTPADDPTMVGTLYRSLVEQIPAVTYVSDFTTAATLRYVSPQIERLLGYPPSAFLEDPGLWYRCVHPDDLEAVRAEELRTYHAQEPFDFEMRMIHREGHEILVWERDAIIRDDDGTPTHTQGVLIDITLMRTMRAERDAARTRAARYLDVAGAAIVVLDADGQVELMNRAGYDLLGVSESAPEGHDLLGLIFGLDPPPAPSRRRFLQALTTGTLPPRYERELRRADASTRVVAWTTRMARDDHGRITGSVSSGNDVTERRAAAEQIVHLANHDAVTDLPNRRLFSEHLDLALARAQRQGHAVALLYLDLDDFKLVNDSLGHSAGDRLLVKVSRRLQARTRSADLLARHGGDEFLVLLGDLDPVTAEADARLVARDLLNALAAPFVVAGAEFQIGASVGISLLPADSLDAETLLRHADAAMYQAKRDGRDEIRLFDPDRGEPLARLSMTTRLRHAILDEELVLHYQPIVDPVSGQLHALEALVRWQDPIRGLVMPAEFVPFAEETGIIEQLGELVLELVVRQRVLWREEGFEPAVHVNLSPRELRSPDFVQRVAARLAADDIDPGTIVVEITETAAMQDPNRVGPLLRELAATGVRIAIDDFGAGHSSLARLIALPVHILKIDRSFLARAPVDPAAAAVLTAVIGLARSLEMATVAEGVETEDQREQLVQLGCPLAQGFLLGRPGPAGDMRAHLVPAAG